MYLIHFHSTNIIKMCFPKVGFLRFQNHFRRSIFISEEKEKPYSTQNCMNYNELEKRRMACQSDRPFAVQICQGCMFVPKKKNPYWSSTIEEETLTSDEYILVFLISILNIYIYI